MPRLLLLDAAGTLIRTAEPVGAVYARHLQAAGLTVTPEAAETAFFRTMTAAARPDYARHHSGHEAERDWWEHLVREVFAACGPEATALAASADFAPCFDALFSHYARAASWAVFPDTLRFLEAAARHARLAVVSNFDARLPPILEGLGLANFFEAVITSGDARASKPDPAIFQFALDRLEAAPHEAIHAGDSSRADLAGARAAGIDSFHLRRPAQTLLDFLDYCEIPAA